MVCASHQCHPRDPAEGRAGEGSRAQPYDDRNPVHHFFLSLSGTGMRSSRRAESGINITRVPCQARFQGAGSEQQDT